MFDIPGRINMAKLIPYWYLHRSPGLHVTLYGLLLQETIMSALPGFNKDLIAQKAKVLKRVGMMELTVLLDEQIL